MMRVAIVTSTPGRVGGAETYVEKVVHELAARGHDVAFFHEYPAGDSHQAIQLPPGVTSIDGGRLGAAESAAALASWRPDVVYTQGLLDPELEAALSRVAPSVAFAHAYVGSCISGSKTHSFPTPVPCHRPLGPGCFAYYYPRRCGGWSPVAMVREYRVQTRRRELLRSMFAVLTFSEHMREEYLRYGLDPTRVVNVTYPLASRSALRRASAEAARRRSGHRDAAEPLRLLFMGRLVHLKGGQHLIDALPAVRRALGRPVELVVAGDGPEKEHWSEKGRAASESDREVSVRFAGWIAAQERAELLRSTDLLVVPSVWPEPFGIVGLEAALAGVPSVAYDVGGVRSWLTDGVTGVLAPSHPPTPAGLAEAIVRASADRERLATMGRAALEAAERFSVEQHYEELMRVFGRAIEGGPPIPQPTGERPGSTLAIP